MKVFFLSVGLLLLPSVALAMMPLNIGMVFKEVPQALPLLHKVAIGGDESGRVVSSDPDTIEAQNAEASGYGYICGKFVGTLNLIEHRGKIFLIGTAHGFYKKGKLRCSKKFGKIYPDYHYKGNSRINHMKGYRFKLPPLNQKNALKYNVGMFTDKNLNDLVVLEVKDASLFKRQLGGQRKTIKMANIAHSDLPFLSEQKNIFLISGRKNFLKFNKISFEENCQIKILSRSQLKIKKHSCDTGDGSSGSALLFNGRNNQLHSAGIHYGGAITKFSNDGFSREFKKAGSLVGNYFIPSEEVIKALDEALIELKRRENVRPLPELPFNLPYGKNTLATRKNWRQVQTVLARNGFYKGKIDGKPGRKTSGALYKYLRPLLGKIKKTAILAAKRAKSELKQGDKTSEGFGYRRRTDSDEIDVVTKGQWKTQNGKKVFTGYYTTAYREGDWNVVCYHYRKISADNLHAKLCLTPKLKIGYHTRFSINLFNKEILISGSSTGTEMELQSRKGKDQHLLSLKEKYPLPNQAEFIRAATLPVEGDLSQQPK